MTRLAILIITILSLLIGSCSGKEEKPKNLIPQNDLVDILAHIYIAEGLLALPEINTQYQGLDSASLYNRTVEMKGYPKEALDITLKYYLTRKPKKLVEIYDQVLAILSEKESIIAKQAVPVDDKENDLWQGKKFYSYPDPAAVDSTDFIVDLAEAGNYILKYSVTLFPGDQTLNTRTTAYTVHLDSVDTGKREYLNTLKYLKDGQNHSYHHILNVNKLRRLTIKGSLYSFDNHPDEWGKHAIIDSVSLTYLK